MGYMITKQCDYKIATNRLTYLAAPLTAAVAAPVRLFFSKANCRALMGATGVARVFFVEAGGGAVELAAGA